jgi:hypothetical protein
MLGDAVQTVAGKSFKPSTAENLIRLHAPIDHPSCITYRFAILHLVPSYDVEIWVVDPCMPSL